MLCDDVCALRTNPACLWQVVVSLLLLLLCTRRCCRNKDMDSDGDVDLVCGGGGGVVWFENLGGSLPSFTVRSVVVTGLLSSSLYSLEYVVACLFIPAYCVGCVVRGPHWTSCPRPPPHPPTQPCVAKNVAVVVGRRGSLLFGTVLSCGDVGFPAQLQ